MNGREKGAGLALFLGLLLIILLVTAGALSVFQYGQRTAELAAAKIMMHGNQGMEIAHKARSAMSGDVTAFADLQRFRRVHADIDPVEQTAEAAGANPADVRRAWNQITMGLDDLLAREQTVIDTVDATLRARQKISQIRDDLEAFKTSSSDRTGSDASVVSEFESHIDQVESDLAELSSETLDANGLTALTLAIESMQQSLAALTGSVPAAETGTQTDGAQAHLTALTGNVRQLSEEIPVLTDTVDELTEARRAAALIDSASLGLVGATAGVRNQIANKEQPIWQSWWLTLVALGGAALCALAYMFRSRKPDEPVDQLTADSGAEQLDKHQEAILRLLDEMGNLADGDLTVEATVTEDITGAIADSINYAIEALRELVSTIDGAAESVDSAAQQTQAAANHLARASENQARQVASATESITKMATTIEQVSSNAERSSEVARHSVEIAHKGGEAVRRTIDGMNTIRETIQDTSKRIKRLGESSQEIGNIVELINDIAEQTNILALNASIQASMAGEAGRGFAVVADEVQRLAERSTSATKQIEVLVKTIQSDTNEAVVSMERSTTDVVSGALLAENAGAALDEIEKVSNQIASLVQNISGMGRQQAMAAADVTRNMGVLQEISAQTADNTNATSNSIGKLAEMASLMRASVAGFTLPQEKESAAPEVDDEMLNKLAAEKNEFIETLIVSERNST